MAGKLRLRRCAQCLGGWPRWSAEPEAISGLGEGVMWSSPRYQDRRLCRLTLQIVQRQSTLTAIMKRNRPMTGVVILTKPRRHVSHEAQGRE